MITLLYFITSFIVVFLCVPLVIKIARHFKVLDVPNQRKIHKDATPLLGGVAIYIGLIVCVLLNLKTFFYLFPIFIGATIILIMGIIDDVKGLSAQIRLVVQILIALMLIHFNMRISFLSNNFWGNLGEILITILWVTGVTNAYNYLDGMDGLAAGSSVVNLLCFGAILFTTGQFALMLLAAILAGACLGFLPYNFKSAKIFLGESGSTLLGFMLASFALVGNWASDSIVKISIPILILGVPIFDMIFTTIMRIKGAKVKTIIEWLKYGGKDHFHHCLVDLGLRPMGAVIFIYCITFSLGISAIMLSNDRAVEALLSLAQGAIIFAIIATLIVVGKRKRSGWEQQQNSQ